MNDNLIIANSSFAFQSLRKVIRSRQLRCKHTNSPTPILDANYLAFLCWASPSLLPKHSATDNSSSQVPSSPKSHRHCLTMTVLTIGIRGMTQLRSVSTVTLPMDHGHLQGFLQTPKQKCNHAPDSATALQHAQLTITAVLVISPVCAALPCA